MNKHRSILSVLSQVMTLPFMAIAFFLLVQGASGYTDTSNNINKTTVQDIVEKYAIQCYASEGSYPPDLEYLVENYGLILDEDLYVYEYDIFASNIMPEIIVHDNIHQTSAP